MISFLRRFDHSSKAGASVVRNFLLLSVHPLRWRLFSCGCIDLYSFQSFKQSVGIFRWRIGSSQDLYLHRTIQINAFMHSWREEVSNPPPGVRAVPNRPANYCDWLIIIPMATELLLHVHETSKRHWTSPWTPEHRPFWLNGQRKVIT
jgi:hypothetical protein